MSQESDPLSHLPVHRPPAPLSLGLSTNHPIGFPVCGFAAVGKHHKQWLHSSGGEKCGIQGSAMLLLKTPGEGPLLPMLLSANQVWTVAWQHNTNLCLRRLAVYPLGVPCLHIAFFLCVYGHMSFLA